MKKYYQVMEYGLPARMRGNRMVKILVCVDDTDDISKKTSTGKVAEMMAGEVKKLGGEIVLGITRHQHLLHESIAYTSHNSSMCFESAILEENLDSLWENMSAILRKEMAETSDPGLCMCRMDSVSAVHKLIAFGKRSQQEVLQKKEAFHLAEETDVRLEAFNRSGLGVIGALAGMGLRLSGNDGTFRGKNIQGINPGMFLVGDCKKKLDVSQVITMTGQYLPDDREVYLEINMKLIYFNHQKMAIAEEQENGVYKICDKSGLYNANWKQQDWRSPCDMFSLDNDKNECYGNERSCHNCQFRRWTPNGISCVN
ncbi:hypothetical protein [Parasporobacterium paucivorans]|uniref:Uncharacterized protein n=1 Tax=Parasporobacterium paucivorans DSM 15970 TaxID=1122934 RepID=A0A1M6K7J6_9FIRM|nr:hypothetical protein [Parasporobacterium paucivorans]SHJ54790.1 hypothetical protein SAMN02745691_02141 [Parasporobacterium paucivorans DSM 15970]